MALPKIDVPIYEINLVSQKQPIKFRPFLVKEEKLFLMAKESKDEKNVVDTIKQVIKNCVLSEVDVDNLPVFDIEYLFLNLRARSMGENVELNYRCTNQVSTENNETKNCNNIVSFDLNLLEIKPTKNENHNNTIQLTDNVGIVMKYPSMNMVDLFDSDVNDELKILNVILSMIDYIYDKENIYHAKDTTKKDLEEFVDSLRTQDLEKIKNFFDTMPSIEKKLDFKCKKCGYEDKILVKGIQSFFQ